MPKSAVGGYTTNGRVFSVPSKNGHAGNGQHPPTVAQQAKLPLWNYFLADLRRSNLTDQTIRENGLYYEPDQTKLATILCCMPDHPRQQIPPFCWHGGLVFPYRNLEGVEDGFARVKPRSPRTRDGDKVKYEQPWGVPNRAYYPVASLPKLRDVSHPLYIDEGEKKVLALSQLGLAAVGISGTSGWRKKGTEELIDDLVALPIDGRVVYVIFDHDEKPRAQQNTATARRKLARALRKVGAKEVYFIELPPGPEGGKQGFDDFLFANADHGAEAFQALVEQAQPAPEPNAFAPLTKVEGRTDVSNAVRLGARYGEVVRWVGPWDKWLIWDGTRWKVDRSLAIDLKAKDIAADLWVEIGTAQKEDKG